MAHMTGWDAIDLSRRFDLPLSQYADPSDGARTVSLAEAVEIAREDPELIYIDSQAHTRRYADLTRRIYTLERVLRSRRADLA